LTEQDGVPSFINGETLMLRYRLPSGAQWWYLADQRSLDCSTGDYYRVQSSSDTPPLAGWQIDGQTPDGQAPPPTVSVASAAASAQPTAAADPMLVPVAMPMQPQAIATAMGPYGGAVPAPPRQPAATCPSCAREQPPGGKFCTGCGAPAADATALETEAVGSPVREIVLEGEFRWGEGQPAAPFQMKVLVDGSGGIFGANRKDRGWVMHYRGALAGGLLSVRSVFNSGLILAYQVQLALGAVDRQDRRQTGGFTASCVVERPGATPEHAMPVGARGVLRGEAAVNYVKAASFVIGKEEATESHGGYQWDDDGVQHDGFEVRFTVDRTGSVFGSNRNRVAGAEKKSYRGSFRGGELSVDAVFESGQVIRYTGRVLADMSWQGRVEVVTAGANAAHFKPVGTTGSVWGSVQIARAEDAHTRPLGMPMREYELGGDRNGGWYEYAGEPRAPNWQVRPSMS
jgi:hypothetical protein